MKYISNITRGVKSLIDELHFFCSDWVDPEGMGIKGYVLLMSKNGQQRTPLMKIAKFDPTFPAVLRLGNGTFSLYAEIIDIWGGRTFYTIIENIITTLPTNDERSEFRDSGVKEALMGGGDPRALTMLITLEAEIAVILGPIIEKSASEELVDATVGVGQVNKSS